MSFTHFAFGCSDKEAESKVSKTHNSCESRVEVAVDFQWITNPKEAVS